VIFSWFSAGATLHIRSQMGGRPAESAIRSGCALLLLVAPAAFAVLVELSKTVR
jgi:hypothetical protein